MKHVVYYDTVGRVTRTTGLPDGSLLLSPALEPGESHLVLDTYQDTTQQYVSHGRLVPIPPQPSSSHEWDWSRKVWVYRPAIAARQARRQRDALLAACDWTQLPDVPTAAKAAWAAYRQALRDVTTQPGFPEEVAWPHPPA